MAVEITVQDVKSFCAGVSASDATIDLYIAVAAEADACLDSRNVPESIQKALKLNAICHSLVTAQGGFIQSESDFDGASVSFSVNQNAKGLARSSFGEAILGLDRWGCIKNLFGTKRRYARAIG